MKNYGVTELKPKLVLFTTLVVTSPLTRTWLGPDLIIWFDGCEVAQPYKQVKDPRAQTINIIRRLNIKSVPYQSNWSELRYLPGCNS